MSNASIVNDTIAKVQEARDALDALDPSVFDKPNDQEKLTKKLDKAINELGNAKYDKALKILEKDIIDIVDGCNLIEEPDEDDKIMDCDAQGVVYPLVVQSINMLRILVFDDENTVMLQGTSSSLAQNGDINISGSAMIGGNLDATGGVSINGSAVIDSDGKWIGDPTGLVGPQGPAGEDGAPGINGTNGVDGEDGEDGAPGINGTNGEDGADGIDGFDGLDGTTPWTELAGYPSISTTGSIRIADDPTICDDTYEGTIRYNSTTATFEGCNGTEWIALSPQGTGDVLYAIGDTGPAGGIVFYVTDGGLHGMEVGSIFLLGGAPWGCYGQSITGADGEAVGTGAQNTADILGFGGCGEEGIAAMNAAYYPSGQNTGWYLPSKEELYLLQQQGHLTPNVSYWSSTEHDANSAWALTTEEEEVFQWTSPKYLNYGQTTIRDF